MAKRKGMVWLSMLQYRMVRDWLVTGRQADLDAFENDMEPYGITKEQCKKEWDEIFAEMKSASRTLRGKDRR